MRNHAFISVALPCVFATFGTFSTIPRLAVAQPLTSASAQVTESAGVITLTHAVQWALARNPDIAVARREYEASEGALLQGQARPNPELAFTQEGVRSANRTSALQINMPIELGDKRQARMDAAERAREAAAAELQQRRAEVRVAVLGAFFDVLSTQEHIRLSQETLALTQRVTDITGKRVLAGKISPVEETKARVAEGQVRVELAQAQGDLRASRYKLAALWGDSLPRFEGVTGTVLDLPEVPSVAHLDQRMAQSPSLRRAELELQRRTALTRVEQSKRLPDPTLSLGIKRAPDVANQILLGIAMPIPIFDSNKGNILEALRREEKARDEFAAQRLRLQSEALQARERLLTARAGADVMRAAVVPGAQSVYVAAGKGFDAGKFSFLETLDAQRTFIQAQSQYLRAVADAHRAAFDIERLLGDAPIEQNNRN